MKMITWQAFADRITGQRIIAVDGTQDDLLLRLSNEDVVTINDENKGNAVIRLNDIVVLFSWEEEQSKAVTG